MKAKKYAWIHVLENGYINHKPSYYGGWEPIDKGIQYDFFMKNAEKEKQAFLEKIKKYGVNWNKTDDIQSDTYSKFLGTFCDPADEIFLEGWITLNNGDTAFFCSENIDASVVFSVMAKSSEYEEKMKTIFGE